MFFIHKNYGFFGKQAIIYSDGKIPSYADDLTHTELFKVVVHRFLEELKQKESSFLKIFPSGVNEEQLIFLLQQLARFQMKYVVQKHPELAPYFDDIYLIHQFVESLYNFWRSYERFFVVIH